MDLSRAVQRVSSLLDPRNIAVIGASDRAGSWPAVVWETVRSHGWSAPVYAVNPNRDTIGDAPCYRSVKALPEPPDHVVMLVPAPHIPDAVREAAEAGARSATVFAAGFGEDGSPAGEDLGARLSRVIADTGIAVQGPNCTGNIIARNGLVTLVDHRALHVAPGPVGLVGQSGGVLLYANHILADRGIQIGALVSSGNEIDLACADYIAWMAEEPSIKVIFCYLDAVKDAAKLKAACIKARDAGKPVIVFKIGRSEEGRRAAMTHTGKLAGSAEVFDAVMAEAGVVRVASLDDAIEAIELVVHLGVPLGRRVGALSLSGAYRGILIDGAEGSGLQFPKLAPAVEQRLAAVLGTGSSAGNPADGGFTVLTSVDKYVECVDILCDDPGLDLLLLQAELPRETGMAAQWEERFQRIHDLVAARGKKLAFISMYSRSFTPYTREVRARLPHVAFVQETRKAVAAITGVADWSERAARAAATPRTAATGPRAIPAETAALIARARASATDITLDEAAAKRVLASYGIAAPREIAVRSADEAVRAAGTIGHPVVLKALSDQVIHKSDVGGVMLGLTDADAVRGAVATMTQRVAKAQGGVVLDRFLVAQQVSGGVELVLGADRDPEMGPVVMAGAGGVLLELVRDVAFAPFLASREEARRLIEHTRVSRLLAGYRGSARHDLDALADALLAVSRLAEDLGGALASIDVNPLLSRAGAAPVALDAVIVLRGLAGAHA